MPPSINESISKLREFIDLWVKFHEIYKEAAKKESIEPQEEELFLETKSVIARKFQTLADSVAIDKSTAEKVYDIINQLISLSSLPKISPHMINRIEEDWHQSYISLNRVIGRLESQKRQAGGPAVTIARTSRSVSRFIFSILIMALFVLLILFLAYALGIFK